MECVRQLCRGPLYERDVLYLSGSLQRVHKDPFDRVIAADALFRDLHLLSPDEPFGQYGCAMIW